MADNFIIHQSARQYHWTGECFLSVKSFYNGYANYQVKQRDYQVGQKNYLVLNECTKYQLDIDNKKETESFCVFFSPDFVSTVLTDLRATNEQNLDFNGSKIDGMSIFEKNYPLKGLISKLLYQGRLNSKRGMSLLEQDEYYHQLLNAILLENQKANQEADKLLLMKKSTRTEIYQRIYYVKDYIDSNYHKELRLKDLALTGLLSENHLLRNFRQIFGFTPFQYISQKRIEEARRQILESDKSIKDISIAVGYSSFGNFSHYFKSIYGCSPSAFRKGDI